MTYQPTFGSLNEVLRGSVRKFADRPAFGTRGVDDWSWITYAELAARVDELRGGLAGLGVQRGDRVAVISNNCLQWAVGAYATFTLGAIYVPMYEAQLDKDWQFILADSSAKVCFTAPGLRARLQALRSGLPTLGHVVDFAADYADLLAAGKARPVDLAAVSPDEVATLLYTSGTTGNPKGVILTHRNCAWQVSVIYENGLLTAEDTSLAILPWSHAAGGLSELHGMLAVGGAIAICDSTDKIAQYLTEVRPTAMLAVPRIWNKLYQGVNKMVAGKSRWVQALFRSGLRASVRHKTGGRLSVGERLAFALADFLIFSRVRARFGGRLRFAISGAAALSREVVEFLDALGLPVYESYGLTETSSAATGSLPGARRIGAVGRPNPGVTLKLDHEAEGVDAESDEGEVIVYGPCVMKGYYNQPEETARALTSDGGMRTGDLGRIDSDGFLYITGRRKELYKLENGKYVAPAPLEESITLSPYVQQAMVYGDNRPYNVALLVADLPAVKAWALEQGIAVPGDDDHALLERAEVRALFTAELSRHAEDWKSFERVQRFAFAAEFSVGNDQLTPTLKLKRRNVVRHYQKELDALY